MPNIINSSFFRFSLCGKILKLHSHHFAKLLKSVHKLFVISILSQSLPWICLEHINSFQILRICKKLIDFLISLNFIEKIIVHPLFSRLIKIVIHFHCILNLLDLQGILISDFELRDFLFFGLRRLRTTP